MTQRTRFTTATSVTFTWAFTYNNASEQLSTTLDSGRLDLKYDPWGRLATRSAVIGGQTCTATYTYWFGDKLKRIDSNFPGETALVTYNYDGLGKRRWRQGPTFDDTFWRWDTLYSVLTEHNDTGGLWSAVGDMSRFFVPFGHTAPAQAALDSTGTPANAAYTYLAHDHLGSGRHGFNDAKTVVSQNEHLPFGQRSYVSGNSSYHEFTGKPWDPDANLYYFPFRYYSPNMNRWTTPDPVGLMDGPNVYTYVKCRPIFSVDFLGLYECGPEGFENIFPDRCPGMGTLTFTACCKVHDDCYSCGSGYPRLACEQNFQRCLVDTCETSRDSLQRTACFLCALPMALLTLIFGKFFYQRDSNNCAQ